MRQNSSGSGTTKAPQTDPEDLGFGFLFDLLPDAVLMVDAQGQILVVNPAATSMFGYTADELVGVSVDRLLPEALRNIHESHRHRYHENPQQRPMGIGLELLALRKDGAEFPVEISLSPIHSDDGLLVTAIVRDITRRKLAEVEQTRLLEEARTAWRHFEGLVEAAPDAVVIVGEDGRITRVNRQTEIVFGHDRDELLGQRVEVLIPNRFRDVHINHLRAYVADPQTRPMGVGLDLYGLKSDGSEFPVEISLSPLRDGGHLVVKAIIRDVSERKATEQQLQLAAQALEARTAELESFAYSVSHDLRAPLRSIDGFSQAVLEDYADAVDDRGKRYLKHVREAAQEMGQLIDDLLQLSRVSRSDLYRTEVDLSEMVRTMSVSLSRSEPDRHVKWEIEPGIVVDADERLLRIAVENLLSNAWKFTRGRDEARIQFGRHPGEQEPEYFVRDNGAGFDMTYVGKLFAPFQRLHSVSEFEGTGIGLATVQRIVRRHGGLVRAEGEIDRGATFSFTLPERQQLNVGG